jgi:hypothetical protein
MRLHRFNLATYLPITQTKLEDLDEQTVHLLDAMVHYGAWKLGKGSFANFSNLLKEHGVPDTKEKLIAYLKGIEAGDKSNTKVFQPQESAIQKLTQVLKSLFGWRL